MDKVGVAMATQIFGLGLKSPSKAFQRLKKKIACAVTFRGKSLRRVHFEVIVYQPNFAETSSGRN